MLASVERVLALLQALADGTGLPAMPVPPALGSAPLAQRSLALFGPAPPGRGTRIMVTLPSEAATDAALVRTLVQAGMDVARINCAHDDADAWQAMAAHVRAAAAEAGRPVRVMMDLAGPKIRTGPVEPGPAVLRLRPVRDELGRLGTPAVLLLRAEPGAPSGSSPSLVVDADWLGALKRGDRIRVKDSRGRVRRLHAAATTPRSARLECRRSAYLANGSALLAHGREQPVAGLQPRPGRLLVVRGQRLLLARDGLGRESSGRSPAVPTAARPRPRWPARCRRCCRRCARASASSSTTAASAASCAAPAARRSTSRSRTRPRVARRWPPTRASTCPTAGSICRR